VKRPTMLLETLLTELGGQLGLSVQRDVEEIRRRVEHEGMSFLYLTLPHFSDTLEQGIEEGRVTRQLWEGFWALPRQGCLPRIFLGFTTRVFYKDGRLLDDPCPEAIFALRQVCRLFKKPRTPCSEAKNLAAMDKFVDVEAELRDMTDRMWVSDPYLDKISSIIWSDVFSTLDYTSLVSRHGPGNTAESLKPNQRLQIRKWYDRSELFFPSDLHCIPNYGHVGDLSRIEYLGVSEEQPVRVVFVPKTLKAPRVIAIEPSHVQYMQQGLMAYCVPLLENHPLTRNSIHFRDQSINYNAARQASVDRRHATLDLSDASDRVHLDLVRRIFRNGCLLDYLEASRSLYARLPDAREVILSKFASMGSAMCFPVEAMVFYTLIQSAVHQRTGIRPTARSVRALSKHVHVYGDDLIVPTAWKDCVISKLEAFGLRVNRSKSFARSHFRESCGGDFFNGVSVKPVYAREVPYDDMTTWTPSHFMSWAKTSDQFYRLGLWSTAQLIRDWIEGRLGSIPRGWGESSGLGFFSCAFTTMCNYDTRLHNFRQKRWVFSPLRVADPITSYSGALLKVLTPRVSKERQTQIAVGSGFNNPWSDGSLHVDDVVLDLKSSVKRGAFKPKRRWVSVNLSREG